MNNFDLRKYLAEGKLLKENTNPIWTIGADEDDADISDAGLEYIRAVSTIIDKALPDASIEDQIASMEVINNFWHDEARKNAKGSEPEEIKVSAIDFADSVIEHYKDVLMDKDIKENKITNNKMNNFDLRKYLAEGRLLKEDYNLPDSDSNTDKYVNNHWDSILKDILRAHTDLRNSKGGENIPERPSQLDIDVVLGRFDGADEFTDVNPSVYEDYFDFYDMYLVTQRDEENTKNISDEDYPKGNYDGYTKRDDLVKLSDLAEGKILKEDVSSGFINKYLSMVEPENFKDIEDIESYSDRDKAIFLYLEIGPGIMVSDELARDLKDKPSEEIVQYFKDRNYSYMPYSAMDKIFGSITPTGMEFERGAPDKVHLDRTHNMRINKILRNKYSDVIDFMKSDRTGGNEIEVHNAIQDRYSDEAKDGRSREVSYEEYASDFADAIRDRM
jgi:hypothetical protein